MLADELPVHRARRAARANPELHVSSAAVANDLSSATNDSPDHLGYLEVLGIGDMDSLLGEGQTCKKKKSRGSMFLSFYKPSSSCSSESWSGTPLNRLITITRNMKRQEPSVSQYQRKQC